ncbi:unnamed protein product [Prorocentrum cordatum]|uniref:Uncharacterized protein n=1 Tax=Prorocentrum cordatum TaxID=2364126 RepID=A0ABN9X879_9DINO|nr:unnamed protein product [Polarella glacialis]CAK0894250.1 unnamed protein product [Polarella glacialis]
MVRPVVYAPTKAFKLSDAETARYKEINAAVAGKKGSDPNAALAKIEAALALVNAAEQAPDDSVSASDAAFVGIVLGGADSGEAVSGGDLAVDTEDVTLEEPRAIAEDEEDEEDERSLWGDGEDDPNEEKDE